MQSRYGDRGAAAVEFALVLPLLVLLFCGIVDFGRAYNTKLTLTHAAREGVRVWALGGTGTETTTAATNAAGLTVTVATTPCAFGAPTTVTVTSAFSLLTPLIANLAPGLTTLSSNGVMRCGG